MMLLSAARAYHAPFRQCFVLRCNHEFLMLVLHALYAIRNCVFKGEIPCAQHLGVCVALSQ